MRNSSVLLIAVCAALLLSASLAVATTCNTSHGNCDASVVLTAYTGDPTVVCLIGHPVVRIRVTVTCGGQQAGPFEKLICGVQSDAFVFEALGYQHTVEPNAGYDWEAILGGSCEELDYNRHPL
jgi:hypothetical protein